MKTILFAIGFLLLAGCAPEQPMVNVVTESPMPSWIRKCVDEWIKCKPLGDGRYDCNQCVHTATATGKLLKTLYMPVVTFDSRMANDPAFKASVVRFEYQ